MPVQAVRIAACPSNFAGSEVERVSHDSDRLVVEMTSRQSEGVLRVSFEKVIAFRVIDEAYLLEFWEAGVHDGPVFEIFSGGWQDHERARDGAVLLKVHYPSAREFLVAGGNDCVSVLAEIPPTFEVTASR